MKKALALRRFSALLAILMAVSLISAGCVQKTQPAATAETTQKAVAEQTTTTAAKEELKPATLSWYLAGNEQPDEASAEAEANKILKEKINASLDMIVTPFGSYDQKMQVKMASGEEFDLCFTTFGWLNKYKENVAKGAFLSMDDLLDRYAPDFFRSIPQKYWDATRVGGKIYGAPNYQIMVQYKGFQARKDLADKYKLNLSNTTIKELEAFLEQVKKNEKGIIPMGIYKVQGQTFLMDYGKNPGDYWEDTTGGAIKFSDKTYTLQNNDTSPELKQRFENYIRLMRKWYVNEYIAKDAASKQNINEDQKAGRLALWTATIKPGGDAEYKAKFGYDIVQIPMSKPIVTAGSALATLTVISRTSKNPERATMLLELVNTDRTLYNLLVFGIENKHYKKITEDNAEKIEKIENGGYWSGISWELGNQFNAFLIKGQSPSVWEETKKLNEEAIPSPLLGFVPDIEPVKALAANIKAVEDEYVAGLHTGTLDPDNYLPIYYEKQKQADPEHTIMKEVQKQLDEWLKQQGKK